MFGVKLENTPLVSRDWRTNRLISKENDPLMIEYLEKKIYDQKQLLEISKALNSTLDYKYLMDAILNICLAQLQTLQAAIYVSPEADSDFFELDPSYKGFDLSENENLFELKQMLL